MQELELDLLVGCLFDQSVRVDANSMTNGMESDIS
jgi:hypothetical protein